MSPPSAYSITTHKVEEGSSKNDSLNAITFGWLNK